jgi:hypothetical protein
MYLIRRGFKVKSGMARRAGVVLAQMCKALEDVGQRSPSRVYMSGGEITGPENHVYMDWIAEAILSPRRPGNDMPKTFYDLRPELHEVMDGPSWIEFYELISPLPNGEVPS